MKGKWNPGAAAVVLFLVLLAGAFAGTFKPNPLDYVVENCYDGINNDGDSDPFAGGFTDIEDAECIFMPFKAAGWSSGEYDGRGLQYPLTPDIDIYVQQWNQSRQGGLNAVEVSHFDAVKALHEYLGADVCSDSRVQDSIILYRDTYGIPDWATGVYAHQSQCGVSY